MIIVKSFNDFIQLIQGSDTGRYQVCLESDNLGKGNWPAARFVDYLGGLEQGKHLTGVTTDYESVQDGNGRVIAVDITITFPNENKDQCKNYYMHWIVRAK